MPTNSPDLIAVILGELDSIIGRANWAVLHREADLGVGTVTSDVDVIVAESPLVVIRQLTQRLAARDILLVQTWEYDLSERSSIFVDLHDYTSVQLDLVRDTRGHGVCGYRSDVLLANSIEGDRWPTLSTLDSHLYTTRKRQVKANVAVLKQLHEERSRWSLEHLELRTAEVFEPRAATALLALLRGPTGLHPLGWHKGWPYGLRTWFRRFKRVFTSPGHVLTYRTSSPETVSSFLQRKLDLLSIGGRAVVGSSRLADRLLATYKPTFLIRLKASSASEANQDPTAIWRDILVRAHERTLDRI